MASTVNATALGAEMARNTYDLGYINFHLARLARGIWPRKTWAYLGALIGTTQRVSKHRLAGTRSFTVEEVASLLRTDHGRGVLAVLMGNARPAWYDQFLKQSSIAEAKFKLDLLSAELDELHATMGRGKAARRVWYSHVDSTDADWQSAPAGNTHRTVDPLKSK